MQGSGLAKLSDVQGGAATPAPPANPGVTVTLPLSARELSALRARRSEISSQITNITDRRQEIANQLRGATSGADRAGLEGRLTIIDNRIASLESELEATGHQLIAARGSTGTLVDPNPSGGPMLDSEQITAIAIVFTLAVLMPLSIAFARTILRRGKHAAEQPSRELTGRLDRMEEGIEAIAIEVERISEGQRFVTKVIGQGSAQPISVAQREGVEVER